MNSRLRCVRKMSLPNLDMGRRELSAQKWTPYSIVVIDDTLDRCRPSYAVELLEVAQALAFAVDNIVFVLAPLE